MKNHQRRRTSRVAGNIPRSGEYRVAENNTRRRVTQGGGTGRCLHKGIFFKGHNELRAEGGESRVVSLLSATRYSPLRRILRLP